MSADRFLYEATMPEIEDIIQGQEWQQRHTWEQTRLLISTQCDMEGKDLTDLIEFPWERKKQEPLKTPSEEEYNRLKNKAAAMQQAIHNATRK